MVLGGWYSERTLGSNTWTRMWSPSSVTVDVTKEEQLEDKGTLMIMRHYPIWTLHCTALSYTELVSNSFLRNTILNILNIK